MFKEKLFKFLFPQKNKKIKRLEKELEELELDLMEVISEPNGQFAFQFDFSEVDDFGKPKHYLEGLGEVERKNYIADLEGIYSNKKFMAVLNYCVNLIGNKTVQVLPESEMFKGRFMILGIKTLSEELEKAHNEYENDKKGDEKFDDLSILPE